MNWRKILEEWAEFLFVTLVLLAAIMLLSGCNGGLTGLGSIFNTGGSAPADTPEGVLIAKLNWMLPLCVLGIALSVVSFAIPAVDKSIGVYGLIGSTAAAGATIALVKYAEWFAILALLAGAGTVVWAIKKNKLSLTGFVDGFQRAKQATLTDLDGSWDAANQAMGESLSPAAEKLVKQHKAKQKTADAMEEKAAR